MDIFFFFIVTVPLWFVAFVYIVVKIWKAPLWLTIGFALICFLVTIWLVFGSFDMIEWWHWIIIILFFVHLPFRQRLMAIGGKYRPTRRHWCSRCKGITVFKLDKEHGYLCTNCGKKLAYV